MKNLIFLIEPSENEFITPIKISNLYLNRFAVDEDAAFEIIGVYDMPKSKLEIPYENSENFENEISEENINHFSKENLEEDLEILDFAFKNIIPKWTPATDYHIIYAGFKFITRYAEPEKMNPVIVKIMENLKLKSLIFTMVFMFRNHIVTKEEMKDFYKGKFEDDKGFDKLSVQDDLDSFFDQANTFYFVDASTAGMFHLPMLTDEELTYLENKDENYLRLYADFHTGENPDVDALSMIKSQSKSKFAYYMCLRFSGSFSNKPM